MFFQDKNVFASKTYSKTYLLKIIIPIFFVRPDSPYKSQIEEVIKETQVPAKSSSKNSGAKNFSETYHFTI